MVPRGLGAGRAVCAADSGPVGPSLGPWWADGPDLQVISSSTQFAIQSPAGPFGCQPLQKATRAQVTMGHHLSVHVVGPQGRDAGHEGASVLQHPVPGATADALAGAQELRSRRLPWHRRLLRRRLLCGLQGVGVKGRREPPRVRFRPRTCALGEKRILKKKWFTDRP